MSELSVLFGWLAISLNDLRIKEATTCRDFGKAQRGLLSAVRRWIVQFFSDNG